MKAPPKQRIRYYLLELTQALLQHLDYFERNTTCKPNLGEVAKYSIDDASAEASKYTIEDACLEILQQTGIRKYELDKSSKKRIDVTHFSKSERQKFEQAQNKIIELEKWVSDLRDEVQQVNRQAAKDRYNLTQLEDLILSKVTSAIERFERANPAVSIKGSLKNLILEETKNVQELLR
jgi:hypothetical protein